METEKTIELSKYLSTIGFLKMLKRRFSSEEAFELAKEGFANFMIESYKLILGETKPNSQDRFDRFRDHYEEAAAKKPYVSIITSEPKILKVRFDRCPFSEALAHYHLGDMVYAFCLSDPAFTKVVLPGVRFERSHEIAKGSDHCDHTWIFEKRGENGN
ncbi:MAG: L-2-amino-thiazoline-4-carboxylic acid hydrolase [Pseudomonadota bacterium]